MGNLLTLTEFGAAVGRSEQTILRWVSDGAIKAVIVGGRKMYRQSDVKAAIKLGEQKRTRKPKSNPALAAAQAPDNKSAAAGGD